MTAFVARFFPQASANSTIEFQTFIPVVIFSGAGLLLSVGVLLLDKYIPGDWF